MLEAFILSVVRLGQSAPALPPGTAGVLLREAAGRAGLAPARIDAVYWGSTGEPDSPVWEGAPVIPVGGDGLAGQYALHAAAQAILAGDLQVALAGSGVFDNTGVDQPVDALGGETLAAWEAELVGRARKPRGKQDRADLLLAEGARARTRRYREAAAFALAGPAAVGRLNLSPRGLVAGRAVAADAAGEPHQAGEQAVRRALAQAELGAEELDALVAGGADPAAVLRLAQALELPKEKVCPFGCAGSGLGNLGRLLAYLEQHRKRYGMLVSLASAGVACATLVERV